MTSKQKKKLAKGKSVESENAKSTSVDEGDESADTSTLCSTDGERSVHKRNDFICSTAHNAHLDEDYLEDKTRLYGRHFSRSPSYRNVRHRSNSRQSRPKQVSSELLQRKFYPDAPTDDTSSLRSAAQGDSAQRKRRHKHLEKPEKPIPEKPPRKTKNSKKDKLRSSKANSPATARAQTFQSSVLKPEESDDIQSRKDFSQDGHEHKAETEPFLNNGATLDRSRMVIKRKSIVRPLRAVSSAEVPKVYQRRSLTHQNSFSDGFNVEQDEDASASPLRPERHKLQKRESIIHPQREISYETSLPFKPQFNNGRFQNPSSWFKGSEEGDTGGTWRWLTFWDFLVWKLFGKNNSAVPSKTKELNEKLPIFPLEVSEISTPPDNGIRVTWLGHSSLIVQFDGLSILTDPVFSDYAGIMRFLGVKRIRKMPGTVHDLPKIDAVVISHNHYDHLDKNTVVMLNARFGCDLHWFVPFGMAQWMRSVRCTNVSELTWWEEGRIPLNDATSFVFTPAQHWSRRALCDKNKSLWGSWSIIGPRHRFFFAGDSGYCSGFKQIGERYGPFDLAAIPIGAYDPRWILSPQHVDPEGAVQIHLDVKAKRTIGIHWGTFILSDEHYLEPPKKFSEAAHKKLLEKSECFVLSHGESKLII